jgi:hypothetical protein
MIPVLAAGKITIGKIDVVNQTDIKAVKIPGEKGVKVLLHDVLIEGHQGKKIMFIVQVYKNSLENMPMVSIPFDISKKSEKINLIEYEVPNSDIFRYLGKGPHKAYIVVSQLEIDPYGEANLLKDNIKSIPISFDFKEDMKNLFTMDIDYNMGKIAEYAQKMPEFASLQSLCSEYGISAFIDKYTPDAFFTSIASWKNCSSADLEILGYYLKTFIPEWNKYPKELIKNIKLKVVAFVKDLKYLGGIEVGGLANVNAGILLLNVNFCEPESVIYLTHHEFFHYVDVMITGPQEFNNDKNWEKLNPSGFKYTGAGLKMIDTGANIHEFYPEKGFITRYAMSAVEEDKAEVFAYLMDSKLYSKDVEGILKTDKVLKKKFDYMKELLRKITPDFSEEYFQKLHSIK